MTARCTSDAPSSLPRFVDGFHHVGRAMLDEAFPPPESRAFGRHGDAAALNLPSDLVARPDIEHVPYFLRHSRLSLARDGGGRHRFAAYLVTPLATVGMLHDLPLLARLFARKS